MNTIDLPPIRGYSDQPQGKVCPPVQTDVGVFSIFDLPPKGFGFVYKITSPSRKSYIGQTKSSVSHRLGQHRRGHCRYFTNAINKYGLDGLSVSIISCCPLSKISKEEINAIAFFNSLHPNGYNLSSGGERPEFHKETCAKISKARKGMKFTPEHIANIIQSHKAIYASQEYKHKRSLIAKAQWENPETVEKMCKGRNGRKHSDNAKRKIASSSASRVFSKESCEKRAIKMRALWGDPVFKLKMSAAMIGKKKSRNKEIF